MSKNIAENATKVEKSNVPTQWIESSCNTSISSVVSKNNNYNITNNYTFGNALSAKIDELPTIKDQTDQKDVIPNDLTKAEDQKEIIPFEQKILKLIWKYLSKKDKLSCTLVCKSFNSFISEIDYFRLIVNLPPSTVQVFPTLSRRYKTVIIRKYQSSILQSPMLKMLKNLSHCIDLKFIQCNFDLMTLCKLLRELPLLKTLELKIISKMEKKVVMSVLDLPKLSHLRNLNITMYNKNMNGILEIFGGSNIQSLTLFTANLNMIELNTFFKQHKNSLRSLAIHYCVFYIDLNYSQFKFAPTDFSCFDCLHNLRKLILINGISSLNILKSKCINWLTDLEVYYNYYEQDQINSFIQNYFMLKGVKKHQLSKYNPPKEPIISKIKCPLTQNVITSFYLVRSTKQDKGKYWESEWNYFKGYPLKLSIICRKDVNNFKNLKTFPNTSSIKTFFKWK